MLAPFKTSIMRPANVSDRAWSNNRSAINPSRTAGVNLEQPASSFCHG
jgi:hypothetical protein